MMMTRQQALDIVRERGELQPPAVAKGKTWGEYAAVVLDQYPNEPHLADAIWEGRS